jgi:hypothetical protein
VRIAEGSVGQYGPSAIDARIEYKDWVGLRETRRGEQTAIATTARKLESLIGDILVDLG